MRMRELEQRTGVGRETIRFYIREGLLPEPARSSRNSANYSDDHIARLRAIKRLQEERFLPLGVIKTLLDAEDGDRWLHADVFPHIDTMLRLRLDSTAVERPTIDQLIEQTGLDRPHIDELIDAGTIALGSDGRVSARDAAIAGCVGRLERVGFTRERGFDGDGMKFYADMIDWVVTQEMRLFFAGTAGQVDEAQALEMAESGISAVNDLLAHMHTREILRRLEARRRIANDNL
jgi:DNA-binding transcriptional MerR regulator